MAVFTVRGPFEVPISKLPAARMVGPDNAKRFWQDHPRIGGEKGCYVFAIRAAKGIKPIYIGKATKSFKQEVFTDHKRNKYNTALGSQLKGTPIMYFVILDRSRGRPNSKAIGEVETYLIQAGLKANKRLLNDRKAAVEAWQIKGVVRSSVGSPTNAALSLRQCLNL